ncbi:phosphorybosylanthranilate isomerase [Moorena producens PAL-8-15-08-1]|uniref:Phosphorybosylanthranilate isomerase n=2 Tax=Moorena TaxID=1155738 RepID=A0A1D8TT01_9CYAN|nr:MULTISPECIES: BtpA/SgcQ family protein [Moorena]AOX00758.1 phosphorybosylanthranilate isomerase [Moorena producens PAL-8-15-08-1]NEO49689.1 BtpA/SgcQ family protein [Moorena sp. SIO4A3]NEO76065.1 BtpA/SgcQ family protein [Moorena sp. SIO4G3]OLT60080.1 phosphorybosylanthranilate isomerase [Moorena bouillonii PNG]
MNLEQIFQTPNPIIGVVHLLPLPTSPRWGGSLQAVIDRAEQEVTALGSGGVDGVIVENFFDAPFTKNQVDPAVVSTMTIIVERLMNLVPIPIGINILRNDAHSALAIATCVGAKFIRVNVLTGIMATDQGLIEGQAHTLLRYRRALGSDVKILADVLVKHGQPLESPNITIAVQETIERGLADGVILSGWGTGTPTNPQDLVLASAAAKGKPVFIGSGANWENISTLMQYADGVIVSSSLKRRGQIDQPIDPIRVSQFVEAVRSSVSAKQEQKPIV